jgi:hypothetical protein
LARPTARLWVKPPKPQRPLRRGGRCFFSRIVQLRWAAARQGRPAVGDGTGRLKSIPGVEPPAENCGSLPSHFSW